MAENEQTTREKLGDKLADSLMGLANLLLLALVVGQVFSSQPFSLLWAFVGASAWIILYVVASLLLYLLR